MGVGIAGPGYFDVVRMTVGVEEEFLLVDGSGRTASEAARVCARCDGPLPDGASVQRELRDTQIEVATGICTTSVELREQLTAGRQMLAAASAASGVAAVACGTPVLGSSSPRPQTSSRFARVDDLYGEAATDYEACGCHVHIGVSDKDTAVGVVNHLGRWLPTLLALSVNSPFHHGRDSGYDSWRVVQQSRFPGAGVPPWCADHVQWQQETARMVDCGVLVDENQTFWYARPSPRLPTVEIRVADTAATVEDAVLQALLSRALVRTALADLDRGMAAQRLPTQVAAAAVWTASRYGMAGPAVDPLLSKQVPPKLMLAALLDHVHDALEDADDLTEVRALLRKRHTGAQRQRRAASNGLHAVIRLLTLADNDSGRRR
jgi:carboxylate-amine ligase